MELSANALTTLESLKTAAGIAPEDERQDALYTLLINAASDWVERMTGRKLGLQSYVSKYTPTGFQELYTDQYPIVDIEAIFFDGERIDPSAYDYHETGEIGVVWKDDGWPWTGYRGGLSYDVRMISRSLTVKYTAGYVLPKDATDENPRTLPYDIEMLVMEMAIANQQANFSGNAGLSSYSISDVTWTWDRTQYDRWSSSVKQWARLG